MVKRIILLIVITMIAFSGVALAAGTADVTVSATVSGTCKFRSGGSIGFGILDPTAGGDVTVAASPQPTFWCTKNTSYTITDTGAPAGGDHDDGAIHRMQHGITSSEFIPYSVSYASTGTGTGAGPTNYITMDLSGTVLATAYQDAIAGSYTDTLTLSINP